jgi:acetyltransferase-like isoleucine patch superfamily enzyme
VITRDVPANAIYAGQRASQIGARSHPDAKGDGRE